MNERTTRLFRLKYLLDISSDIQLKMIEKVIKDLIYTEKFKSFDSEESKNFTVSQSRTESSDDFDEYIGEDNKDDLD